MPAAKPLLRIASTAKATFVRPLSTEEAVVVSAFNCTVPPVMVSGPAKLGLKAGVMVVAAGMAPTATVFAVVLERVTTVPLVIALMYQLPVRPVPVTCCPGTRFAVLAKVSVGAVVVPALTAEVAIAAVAPVTVPRLKVAGITAVWLMANWVGLMI